MEIQVLASKSELGRLAAKRAADTIRAAIGERGTAHLIAATGASQLEFLEALVQEPDIEWSRTSFLHLDEYVGLPESHPASFRRYLRERIVDRHVMWVDGAAPPGEYALEVGMYDPGTGTRLAAMARDGTLANHITLARVRVAAP